MWQVGGTAHIISGHCDYFKCMDPLIFFLSKVETVPLLYEFAYKALGVTPCGGPNLQYIKLCKLHFRWRG